MIGDHDLSIGSPNDQAERDRDQLIRTICGHALCDLKHAKAAADAILSLPSTPRGPAQRAAKSICCYCDNVLSCGHCGMEQPDDSAELARTLRKLVWLETFTERGDGSKEQDGWEADSGFGSWYSIDQYFGSDSLGWRVKFEYDVIDDHDDPDKAKESAQADFERRVLALPSHQENTP